jgi:DNA-binding response OmpR family regulator
MRATPTPTADQLPRPVIQLALAASRLEALARREVDARKAALIAAAGADVLATQARLNADLLLADVETPTETVLDLSTVTIGQLRVDRAARSATLAGEVVHLTNTEYAVLCIPIVEPTRVFTKAEIYRRVWGHELTGGPRTRTLDSHVCRLRGRLGGQPWLPSVHGIGFSLLPPSVALTEVSA